jgi:localization factor PodJL
LVGQLRATLERRRRPLLLGLAAIVLALGTLQAVNGLFGGSEPPASVPTVAQAPIVSPPAKPIDPPTTQALAEPAAKPLPPAPPPAAAPSGAAPPAVSPPSAEKPGADKPAAERTSIVPRIAGAALGGDLAGLPASFAPLRQAALEGDGAALYEIASRAGDGRGMTRDLALSAKLFERLSNAGYAPAQYRLGSQYEKGMGVTRDAGQARVWYGRAADQGHVRAMHNLAVMLAESGAAGGKPDYAAAAQWFRRAAEFGIRDSQYNLAVLLARGLGASQDLVQSYGWFAAAAAQGDEDAGRKRDEVAGKLSPKDLAAAKAGAEAWKPKSADPAVNEPPPPRPESTAQAAGPMSLIGAPPPAGAQRRPEPARSAAKPAGTGV